VCLCVFCSVKCVVLVCVCVCINSYIVCEGIVVCRNIYVFVCLCVCV
jgi:hypothetical protein